MVKCFIQSNTDPTFDFDILSSADVSKSMFKDDLAYLAMTDNEEGGEYKSSKMSTKEKFLQLWDKLEYQGDKEVDHMLFAFILFRACSFFGANSEEVVNKGKRLLEMIDWLAYICNLTEHHLSQPETNATPAFIYAYSKSPPAVAVALNNLLPQYLERKAMKLDAVPTCTAFCKKASQKSGNI